MHESIKTWLDSHTDELIAALARCVSYPTVRNDATAEPGAPFGKVIGECLTDTLAHAEALGFETKNLDGYCGVIDYGEGDETLGILAHLDVVPEGNGWKFPPYGAVVDDGVMYGRGVLDDKGPAIAALYALAAVKASGLPMRRKVRIILGCDEESGMQCLAHYEKVEPMPDLAFSPDAEYPLVNSEKLIYNSAYTKKYTSSIKIKAGTVSNVVPDEAVCMLPLDADTVKAAIDAHAIDGYNYAVESSTDGVTLTVAGLAAHASMPEQGRNAFYAALALLAHLPLAEEDAKTVCALAELLKFDLHGESFGLDISDASGRLTLNVGVIDWDETGINKLTVDIRAPISAKGEFITEKLCDGFAKAGAAELAHGWSDGYYVSPDSELVSKLMKVYRDYFHDDAKPLAIGGGTYARHLHNAVAFGPERPGVAAPIHMPNECVRIEHLLEDAKIYADAIVALACEE